MSLLEDVFLQDEADEAQDLERVIEGDEYEEIGRQVSSDDDGGAGRDDEAEEDKRRVDPNTTKTKRVVKNPRLVLNPARLTGPRGIHVIPEHFKDFKFKGKGHESEDMDLVLKKLEHWAYRLYPKFKFEDCLKKMETLGKKRPVMVNLHKIRSDQFVTDEEAVIQKDSSGDEQETPVVQEEDEFDKLLQQQIELARNTPARTPGPRNEISTPFTMPKATSSPSISDEQKQRMIENRKKAEQRRLARLKQIGENIENIQPKNDLVDVSSKGSTVNVDEINSEKNKTNVLDSSDEDIGEKSERNSYREVVKETNGKKHYKSNVIDSSDDDIDVTGKKKENGNEEILEIEDTDVRKVNKSNRSQVIHSSDDETYESAKKNDRYSEEMIDLTEIVIAKKHKKSNVLDSSDDDENNTVNDVRNIVDVDLTKVGFNQKPTEIIAVSEKNYSQGVNNFKEVDLTNIEYTNRDNIKKADFGNEIDLTGSNKPYNGTKECEANNVDPNNAELQSDSSDDECNVTTENISITVDVHKAKTAEAEITQSDYLKKKEGDHFDEILQEKATNVAETTRKSAEFDNIDDEIMDVDFSEAF